MEIDINETKSRANNFFIRHFHLSIRLFLSYITQHVFLDNQICSNTFQRLDFPLVISLFGLNTLFLLYFWIKNGFPRVQFFIFGAINIIICSVIFLLGYGYVHDGKGCAKNKLFIVYTILQIIMNCFVCIAVLLMKFNIIIRYSNSPGNIVWSLVMLIYAWDSSLALYLQLIIIINCIISLCTVLINIVALFKGITKYIKKTILIEWIISLILMVICLLLALLTHLNLYLENTAKDIMVKNVILKFILIQIVDLIFWISGLLTLTYQNGDLIRDQTIFTNLSEQRQSDQNQKRNEQPIGIDNLNWLDIRTYS